MEEFFSLKGKRFLITGGTRGIGRAISFQFARVGAQVIANHILDIKSADELKLDADREGIHIDVCRADLTSSQGIQKIVQFLNEKQFTDLSGFVHCAATGVHKILNEVDLRHFDWTFSLNIRAFFDLVKSLLPRFFPGSTILAISSQGAERAVPYYSMVGASKGALESFSRHLAVELAPRGIRVNILRPGSVMTDAWKSLPEGKKRLEDTIGRSPIHRLVTTEEVARTAQFLCSDASAGIVGQTIVVDGGVSIVE